MFQPRSALPILKKNSTDGLITELAQNDTRF